MIVGLQYLAPGYLEYDKNLMPKARDSNRNIQVPLVHDSASFVVALLELDVTPHVGRPHVSLAAL